MFKRNLPNFLPQAPPKHLIKKTVIITCDGYYLKKKGFLL